MFFFQGEAIFQLKILIDKIYFLLQIVLTYHHTTVTPHRTPRRSLITVTRRQNAKLKANASLTRDSRATIDNSILHRRWNTAQQSPTARDRT
jgi:hypothetical protein